MVTRRASVKKTTRDCNRELIATQLSRLLLEAGFYNVVVHGGGEKGPYAVTVHYLSRKRLEKVVKAVCDKLAPERVARNTPRRIKEV